MQLAIVSESGADESALRIFVEGILECPVEHVPLHFQVRRGWPALRNDLPAAIKATCYRTTATGLVIVVDADSASVDERDPKNRRQQISEIVQRSLVRNLPGRPPLAVAIGVAVPLIEAWWLAPTAPDISESAWLRRAEPHGAIYSKLDLKRRLYGTDRPSLVEETRLMTEAAKRSAACADIIAARFPHGFAGLLEEIRRWKA